MIQLGNIISARSEGGGLLSSYILMTCPTLNVGGNVLSGPLIESQLTWVVPQLSGESLPPSSHTPSPALNSEPKSQREAEKTHPPQSPPPTLSPSRGPLASLAFSSLLSLFSFRKRAKAVFSITSVFRVLKLPFFHSSQWTSHSFVISQTCWM